MSSHRPPDEAAVPFSKPGALHQRSFQVQPVPPFRLDLTAWALRRRMRNRMDVWDGRYRRAVLVDGEPATIEVAQRGGSESTLTISVTMARDITTATVSAAADIVDRLLGVRSELSGFYDTANRDPRLRDLKDRFLGVHPPRFPTLFEALANAVANQQLTLDVGIELLNRLTDAYGAPAPTSGSPTCAAFPSAEAVAGTAVAPLRELGFSSRKAEYLIGLAESVLNGDVEPDELAAMERAEATRHLQRLRGIGRWSAEYVLLRGLGRLDVFPGDDVGARNKLRRFLELRDVPDYPQILSILEPWYPYAGMVYFHLLLDGLAERGDLASVAKEGGAS